nr:hypothetical protein [Tanacetum cinerariifolium]
CLAQLGDGNSVFSRVHDVFMSGCYWKMLQCDQGDMGAEMCVLGYGSEDVVQAVWFRSCALFGCALWSVVQGLWFKGVGEKTWLGFRPFKFEKQWSWL